MLAYFKDKTVVITGAASGIGRSLTETLAGAGVTVHALDLQAAALQQVAEGCGARAHAVDVTDGVRMAAVAEEILAEGFVDVVIANAGVGGLNPAYDFSVEVSRRTVAINVDGLVNTVAPYMARMVKERRGHIVGVSSLASFRGLPNACSYSATKAAQRVMLESWRVDLKPHGVAVSCICPGFVQTPMADHDEFPMPFTVPVHKSTALILKAIARRQALYLYPWPMRLLTLFNRLLPAWLFDWLLPRLSGPRVAKQPRVF